MGTTAGIKRALDVATSTREVAFGLSSLGSGLVVVAELRAEGYDSALDIGRSGWPATVVVAVDGWHHRRSLAGEIVRSIDPASQNLPWARTARESVRVLSARCAVDRSRWPSR